MALPTSSVGRKIVMAMSGQLMVLFVVIHVIGNSLIYFGGLNDYAEKLYALPLLVWLFRSVMVIALCLHSYYGIRLTLENRAANPEGYAVRNTLRTTFASKNMIWSGLLIGAFLVYHLLHFTFQVTNPEIASKVMTDSLGRPDVFRMVVLNFQSLFISFLYVSAMIALLLHLTHGIQSSFQTLGMSNETVSPVIAKTGSVAAFILFVGYTLIPVVVLLGILND